MFLILRDILFTKYLNSEIYFGLLEKLNFMSFKTFS